MSSSRDQKSTGGPSDHSNSFAHRSGLTGRFDGSVPNCRPNNEAPVEDDRWFTMSIRVEGKHIVIKVDGKTITDYTEPDDAVAGEDFTRVLDKGTFALQGHDPDSTVLYRSIRVRRI